MHLFGIENMGWIPREKMEYGCSGWQEMHFRCKENNTFIALEKLQPFHFATYFKIK